MVIGKTPGVGENGKKNPLLFLLYFFLFRSLGTHSKKLKRMELCFRNLFKLLRVYTPSGVGVLTIGVTLQKPTDVSFWTQYTGGLNNKGKECKATGVSIQVPFFDNFGCGFLTHQENNNKL